MDHNKYMDMALKEAEKAFEMGEVPIGCVIVYNDNVIGKGANMRMTKGNVLAHAEIIAINEACNYIGDWRLEDCYVYVTVEPCPMCAGAILQSRAKEVIFGARNPKAGCGGSLYNLFNDERFNHIVKITEGIREEEAKKLMQKFFKEFRVRSSLRDIPYVGKGIEHSLNEMGIYTTEDLKGKDADGLFNKFCGEASDRYLLYVMRLAVYYAENDIHEEEKLRWQYWRDI